MSATEVLKYIPLEQLEDDSTQTRAGLDEEAIVDYTAAIQRGEELPPAVVYKDHEKYWLSSGFHRREAYKRAGRNSMPCVIRPGGRKQAIKDGIANNLKNGVRPSVADRAHNVSLVGREFPDMKQDLIETLCGIKSTSPQYRTEKLAAAAEVLTQEEVAEQAGVSRETVNRAVNTVKSKSKIDPNIMDRIEAGQIKASQLAIRELGEFDHDAQRNIVREYDLGDYKSLYAAIHGSEEVEPPPPAECDMMSHEEPVKEKPAKKKADDTSFDTGAMTRENVVDGLGKRVKGDLDGVFSLLGEFQDQRNKLSGIKRWMTTNICHRGAAFLKAAESRIKNDIDNLDREFLFAMPHCECVYCHNHSSKREKCECCKGLGWITEAQFNAAPSEKRR